MVFNRLGRVAMVKHRIYEGVPGPLRIVFIAVILLFPVFGYFHKDNIVDLNIMGFGSAITTGIFLLLDEILRRRHKDKKEQ